jgi:ABC-type sugar transport system ATPase subunit
MIEVRDLDVRLGAFRTRALSLEVNEGELMVILGPSGAGKSVLLESMLGLKPVTGGRIRIDGRDVTLLPPEERLVAYMPQDVALFPHLSVRDNILFGRRVRGTLKDADADLERIVERMHISHLLERKRVRSLSGGEQQRVALARALITNPRVIFLDESFSALDAHIRRELLLQLRELQQGLGLTVVYVTHSQGEAWTLGDRVAVLMAGCIVQLGEPHELFQRPVNLEVARFLRRENLYAIDSIDGSRCSIGDVALIVDRPLPPADVPCWLTMSPEDVLVLRVGEAKELGLGDNCVAGRIVGLDVNRGRSRLRVRLDDAADVVLVGNLGPRDRLIADQRLQKGDRVEVHLRPSSLWVFPEVTPTS